jgi:hypothetical protein
MTDSDNSPDTVSASDTPDTNSYDTVSASDNHDTLSNAEPSTEISPNTESGTDSLVSNDDLHPSTDYNLESELVTASEMEKERKENEEKRVIEEAHKLNETTEEVKHEFMAHTEVPFGPEVTPEGEALFPGDGHVDIAVSAAILGELACKAYDKTKEKWTHESISLDKAMEHFDNMLYVEKGIDIDTVREKIDNKNFR